MSKPTCPCVACSPKLSDLESRIEVLQEELKWRRGVHGVTGEVDRLKAENERLTERVAELEAEAKIVHAANDDYKSCPPKERFTVQATVTEVRKGKLMQMDDESGEGEK